MSLLLGLNVKLINLTPHDIVLYRNEKPLEKIPRSGKIARVRSTSRLVQTVAGWPIFQNMKSSTTGLPDPQKGVLYIVSELVARYNAHRDDLIYPETWYFGVKDKRKKIIGTYAFRKADLVDKTTAT